MDHREGPAEDMNHYPHGRGYGHDYMRGGEVLGGYGYSERDEYTRTRGELGTSGEFEAQRTEPEGEPEGRAT
ncbi:MAG: hypothetical protein ACJ8AO_19820 [Gemmatimonadaceae bacterium]